MIGQIRNRFRISVIEHVVIIKVFDFESEMGVSQDTARHSWFVFRPIGEKLV